MANPIGWADSAVEGARELVREEVDALWRCPAERKEAATREALSKLEPHLEGASEPLEVIGRVRGLTEKELAQRGTFMPLLDLARQPCRG